MWSRPVTLGGGITMTNRGEPGRPVGWNRPSRSQSAYQRSSNCAGSKVFSSPRVETGGFMRRLAASKKGSFEPFHISDADALLFDAGLELLDALFDDQLGDVGDHLPGDLPQNAVREALDDAGREAVDVLFGELPLGLRDGREHLLQLADRGGLR